MSALNYGRYLIRQVTAGAFAHNALSGKQGGTAGEYYHLTQALHDGLYSASPLIGLGSQAGTNIEVDYGGGHILMKTIPVAFGTQKTILDVDAANSQIIFGIL